MTDPTDYVMVPREALEYRNLPMKIAIAMEVGFALNTTTKAKAEAIAELLRQDLLSAAPPPPANPDDIAVDLFAAAMKDKLAKKRAEGRAGWSDKKWCPREYLSRLLREHVEKGDPLDVGNLAMMLHQRGERIAPPPPARETGLREALEQIAEFPATEPWRLTAKTLQEIARAALSQQQETGLREALEFYAAPENWRARGHAQIDADTAPAHQDRGARARTVLSQLLSQGL